MEIFDPKTHICKFSFTKFGHCHASDYLQTIRADLYQKELVIDIYSHDGTLIESFGFSLSSKLSSLLPLLHWEDYEKYRDISGWDLAYDGYRDGWGYNFACLNESGNSLLQNHLDVTFSKRDDKPAYEKLLSWVKNNYTDVKELKPYQLFW